MRLDTLRPYFLLAILLGALALVVLVLQPFLAPLALAAIFAVVLRPIFNNIFLYVGRSHALAGLVTTQIVVEARDLYATLTGGEGFAVTQSLLEQGVAAVSQFVPGITLNAESIIAELDTYARAALQVIIGHLGGLLSSATGFLLNLFIFFIALYYLLKEGPVLKRAIVKLSPLYDTDDEFVFKKLEIAINSVVRGSLLIALIQGVLAT